MRFHLEMELDKPEITQEFRRCIISYIKHMLMECNDGKYMEEYFRDNVQKDYSFTALFREPVFQKDRILLQDNNFCLRFTTDERSKTGVKLMSGFLKQKNKEYPLPDAGKMTLRRLSQEKRAVISNSKVLFRTAVGAGLCIREHSKESNQDKYFTVMDEGFEEQAKMILKNQALAAGFSTRISENISIAPIQCKKVLIKHYGRYVDVTVGTLEMEADSSLLQYFYDAGMGSRKSAGFGMVDLVTQEFD